MENRISIIILHYNNAEMTEDYVSNILRLNWDTVKYHIFIVDNCSPDASGLILRRKYKDNDKICVILNERNLGFAKGNNIGIKKAMELYGNHLIIVSNNDIVLEDVEIPIKIIDLYKKYNFAVLGPDIYCPRKNEHQNPFKDMPISKADLVRKIRNDKVKLFLLKVINLLKKYDLLSFIKNKLKKKKESKYIKTIQINKVLHGSFFVLSPIYLEKYHDGLFPETFLYMEEDILSYRCKTAGLTTVYDPSIKVIHLDGVSSLGDKKNRCKKYINELTYTIDSCSAFLRSLE